jgi:hypothetical protein
VICNGIPVIKSAGLVTNAHVSQSVCLAACCKFSLPRVIKVCAISTVVWQARSWQHVARKTPVDEGRRVHFLRPLSAALVLTICSSRSNQPFSQPRRREGAQRARMQMDKERHFIHTGTNKNAAASAGLFINII